MKTKNETQEKALKTAFKEHEVYYLWYKPVPLTGLHLTLMVCITIFAVFSLNFLSLKTNLSAIVSFLLHHRCLLFF